jgi:hypothetical protein
MVMLAGITFLTICFPCKVLDTDMQEVVNRLSLYWDTKFKKKTDEYVKTVKLLHVDVVNKLVTELAVVNASRRF